MRDEIYDRDLQFGRERTGRDLLLIGQAIASAFAVLTRIRFEAPWRRSNSDCGGAA